MSASHTTPTTPLFKNITGQRFGRLVVQSYAGKTKDGKSSLWLCLCDCGTERVVIRYKLVGKLTFSCGCQRRQGLLKACTKHGCAVNKGTLEYRTWGTMKGRCYRRNAACYPNYGGRGIKVCERWLNSFENFLADMGMKPSPQHTIDRIDNDGNYEPGNCRWATRKEQAMNRRRRA